MNYSLQMNEWNDFNFVCDLTWNKLVLKAEH